MGGDVEFSRNASNAGRWAQLTKGRTILSNRYQPL